MFAAEYHWIASFFFKKEVESNSYSFQLTLNGDNLFSLDPTFTIIIPTYNRAGYLPGAIRSVQKQVFEQWELVIVDDGSTDNTNQVCASFLNDDRIKYVYQENKELNGARNTGVRYAEGKYCCFLDDDDRLLPNHLAVLNVAIASHAAQYDIFRTGMHILRGNQIFLTRTFDNQRNSLVQHWESPGNLLPLAIDTQLLLRQPFEEHDLLLDDFIWLNSALVKHELFQCEEVTVRYVEHEESRTKTYHTLADLPKLVNRLKEAYEVNGVAKRVRRSLLLKRIHHLYLHLAHQLSRQGKRSTAIGLWLQAVWLVEGRFLPTSGKSLLKILTGYRR